MNRITMRSVAVFPVAVFAAALVSTTSARAANILMSTTPAWAASIPVASGSVTAITHSSPPKASYDNFIAERTYIPGMFKDVDENAWYGSKKEKSVAIAYEYNLMSGTSPTTFNPTGNISIAEVVTVATRVHSFYTTGHQVEFTPTPGAPWYQGNVDYAIENGIIGPNVFQDFKRAATRAEMAYVFAHTLPDPELAYTYRYQLKLPPDVDESTLYYDEIMMLYRFGIVGGSDSAGTFHPGSSIMRAEAAAILARIVVPGLRLGDDFYYPGFTS